MAHLVTVAELRRVMPALPLVKAEQFLPDLDVALREFDISTTRRLAAFLSQIAHESNQLSRWVENLNYSTDGLIKTWPARFGHGRKANAQQRAEGRRLAERLARKPEAIANYVYANRGGNGNEASGHGWLYRGRGPGQLTLLDNYRAMGRVLKLDLVAEPDLVATPAVGFRAFGAFWSVNRLNQIAESGDVRAVTRVINPGLLGLAEREEFYRRAIGAGVGA